MEEGLYPVVKKVADLETAVINLVAQNNQLVEAMNSLAARFGVEWSKDLGRWIEKEHLEELRRRGTGGA